MSVDVWYSIGYHFSIQRENTRENTYPSSKVLRVSTPTRVDLPESTFPITATLILLVSAAESVERLGTDMLASFVSIISVIWSWYNR